MLATAVAMEFARVLVNGKRWNMVLVERTEPDEIVTRGAQLDVSFDDLNDGVFVLDPLNSVTPNGI